VRARAWGGVAVRNRSEGLPPMGNKWGWGFGALKSGGQEKNHSLNGGYVGNAAQQLHE